MRENSNNTNTIDPLTIDPLTIDKEKANQKDLQDLSSSSFDKKEKEKKAAKAAKIEAAIEILEYLNLLAGRKFQTDPTKRGKDNVNWVVVLLNKGFTKDEVKAMIEYKCYEWKHDVKMKHLLQPITIFKRHGVRYTEIAIEAMENESLQRDIQARVKAEKKSSGILEVDEKTKETLERMKKYKH